MMLSISLFGDRVPAEIEHECLRLHHAATQCSAYSDFTGLLITALTSSPCRAANTASLLTPKEAQKRILSCALAQVYHSMGNYKQALQCYLDSQDHPQAAFRCCSLDILLYKSTSGLSSLRFPAALNSLACLFLP